MIPNALSNGKSIHTCVISAAGGPHWLCAAEHRWHWDSVTRAHWRRALMGFCTKWQIPFPWVAEPGTASPQQRIVGCGHSRHWACRYYSTYQTRECYHNTDHQNVWPCTFMKSQEPSRPLIGLIFRRTGIGHSHEIFCLWKIVEERQLSVKSQ